MSSPAAGWYADPAGSSRRRWWDGTAWTDALSDPATDADAGPDLDSRGAPAPRAVRPITAAHRRRPVRRRLWWAVALALVVSAGLATPYLWEAGRPGPAVTGPPASAPPPGPTGATTGTAGALDEATRTATVGQGALTTRMRLPAEPYVLVPEPRSVGASFDVAFLANAPVHHASAGQRGWVSTVGLLHVSSQTASTGTPDTVAQQATADLLSAFFPAGRARVRDASSHPCRVDGGLAALRVSADVAYRVPGLASRFDRLTVLVVPLPDGSYVAAFSTVPDDAPPAHTTLAAHALETLAVG